MEKNELREEWASRVRAFRTSGQTAVEWCAVNNLKIHQLKYWLGQQKKMAVPGRDGDVGAGQPAASTSTATLAVTAGRVPILGNDSLEGSGTGRGSRL